MVVGILKCEIPPRDLLHFKVRARYKLPTSNEFRIYRTAITIMVHNDHNNDVSKHERKYLPFFSRYIARVRKIQPTSKL